MAKRGRGRKRGSKRWLFLLLVSFVLVALAIWGATRFATAGRTRLLEPAPGKPGQAVNDEIAPHERKQLEDILERGRRK